MKLFLLIEFHVIKIMVFVLLNNLFFNYCIFLHANIVVVFFFGYLINVAKLGIVYKTDQLFRGYMDITKT